MRGAVAVRSSTASSRGAALSMPTRDRATSRTNTTATSRWTNKDRVYGRVQLLCARPTDNFSARLSVDAQPRGSETTNGRTIQHADATASIRTARSILSPRTTSTRLSAAVVHAARRAIPTQDDYLYGGGDDEVNNDNARPLVTGSNGASLTARLERSATFRHHVHLGATRTITSRRSTTTAQSSTCIAMPAASGTTTSSGVRSCASSEHAGRTCRLPERACY